MSNSSEPAVNVYDVSEETRERALLRTADVLQKLNKLRCAMELPVEHMPFVIETYDKMVLAVAAETDRTDLAKRTMRVPITIQSETAEYRTMKVPPGKVFNVNVRPQWLTFRPEDLAIQGDRARWMVYDFKIGNRSQFRGANSPVAGTEFGPGGLCAHLKLETADSGMTLQLTVLYVGPEPDGEVFEATLVGTATSR